MQTIIALGISSFATPIHNTIHWHDAEELPITPVATESARWKTSTNGKITSGRCQALAFALLLFLLLTNTSVPISRCNLPSNSATQYCSFKSSWTRFIYFSVGTDLYQILDEAIFALGRFNCAVFPFFFLSLVILNNFSTFKYAATFRKAKHYSNRKKICLMFVEITQ